MIIWGTKGRETEIGSGTFYCPKCDAQKPFTHMKAGKYFSLFFIPLFEISRLGEYVQCKGCNTNFNPALLEYKTPTPEQRQVLAVKRDLVSGTPLQMAQTKLTNAGMDNAVAALIVDQAAPEDRRECDACHLTYLTSITRCSICGAQLSLPKMTHKGSLLN